MNSKRTVGYSGPELSSADALDIAWKFVRSNEFPVGEHINTRHSRRIIQDRPDAPQSGIWSVAFTSLVPPDPPNVVTSPAPDSPFVVEVNDQTGEASLFQWL